MSKYSVTCMVSMTYDDIEADSINDAEAIAISCFGADVVNFDIDVDSELIEE